MPFDWEKYIFKPETEVEKNLLKLFKEKHPKPYKKMPTRIPINHEKAIMFFYGWTIGFKDGRYIDKETRLDWDTAFGIDVCAQCEERPKDSDTICEGFPCEKIEAKESAQKEEK